MAHWHVALLSDDDSVKDRYGIAWHDSIEAAEERLSIMLNDHTHNNGRITTRFGACSLIAESERYIGPLVEPRKVQASNNTPLYSRYTYERCAKNPYDCEAEQQAAIAKAKTERKRPCRHAKKIRNRLAEEAMVATMQLAANREVVVAKPPPICADCGSVLRELESGSTKAGRVQCEHCSRGLNTRQEFIANRIMGDAFKAQERKALRNQWYDTLTEAGHRDKPQESNW